MRAYPNISVVLFPQKKKDGTSPIKIRITQNRKSRYINIGFSVLKSQWDIKKERVKSNNPNYKNINQIITLELNKLFKNHITSINNQLQPVVSTELMKPLGEIMRERRDYERQINRVSTEKKINSALRHLEKSKISTTQLIDFSIKSIKAFDAYLHNVSPPIQPSSMGSYHRVIRSTINHFLTENQISPQTYTSPYIGYKTSRKSKSQFGLKASQIIQIEDFITFHQEKDRHIFWSGCIFIFSIYALGMRFGDASALRWSNIIDDKIKYSTEKNGKELAFMLNDKITNILKFFTPASVIYKTEKPTEQSINEIAKWFPQIRTLIEAEKYYLELRKSIIPKQNDLLKEISEDYNLNLGIYTVSENYVDDLNIAIKKRDHLVRKLVHQYSRLSNNYIFPYLDETSDIRKRFNKKGSSNALVNKNLKIIAKKLNLPSINFHMARHTFAYQARMKGFDIFLISKALGHSSLSVTEKYLQRFENDELTLKNKELIDGINESYII